jgi:hypothetical protein
MAGCDRPMCRHCGRRKACRPVGLCWPCYYTPEVRALYPSTSKFARRGVGGGNVDRPPAPEATAARPGSAAKVAVMADRAAAGFALWHPNDQR